MWEVRVLGYVATDNPHILSGLKHKVGFLGYPCPLQGRRVILIDNLIKESSYRRLMNILGVQSHQSKDMRIKTKMRYVLPIKLSRILKSDKTQG